MAFLFKPIFHYTDKIVRDLTQIAAARELVLNSPFIPKWEVSLWQAALKEINKLLAQGVVQLVGKGRGAYYVLA